MTSLLRRYLDYGEEKWREQTRKALDDCQTYADSVKENFVATLDWLHEHACSRSYGLGECNYSPLSYLPSSIFSLLLLSLIDVFFVFTTELLHVFAAHPEALTIYHLLYFVGCFLFIYLSSLHYSQ